MSNVITNKRNTDVIDLTIEQTGTSRSEVFLEEPLLDATRDYTCGCVELCVPLSEEPMITYNVITRQLWEIRRRPAVSSPGASQNPWKCLASPRQRASGTPTARKPLLDIPRLDTNRNNHSGPLADRNFGAGTSDTKIRKIPRGGGIKTSRTIRMVCSSRYMIIHI